MYLTFEVVFAFKVIADLSDFFDDLTRSWKAITVLFKLKFATLCLKKSFKEKIATSLLKF